MQLLIFSKNGFDPVTSIWVTDAAPIEIPLKAARGRACYELVFLFDVTFKCTQYGAICLPSDKMNHLWQNSELGAARALQICFSHNNTSHNYIAAVLPQVESLLIDTTLLSLLVLVPAKQVNAAFAVVHLHVIQYSFDGSCMQVYAGAVRPPADKATQTVCTGQAPLWLQHLCEGPLQGCSGGPLAAQICEPGHL